MSDKLWPPSAAAVDDEESDERQGYEYCRGEVGGGVAEFLDLIVDGDGESAGDAGDVATDHEDYTEFTDGVGEGEDGGGEERGAREG